MKIYKIAVSKESDGNITVTRGNYVTDVLKSSQLEYFLMTSNKELYLKSLLRAYLAELRSYTEHSAKVIEHAKSISARCAEETAQCYWDYEEFLMMRVGRTVGRCMRRDIPVTDEFAILCYNYRESKLERI